MEIIGDGDGWLLPLGGRCDLGIRRLGRTSAPGSATTAAGLPGESTSCAALAAASSRPVECPTATASHTPSRSTVVATSICVRLGSSLLNDDVLAVDGVRVRGHGGRIARLVRKLDKGAVLSPALSAHVSTTYQITRVGGVMSYLLAVDIKVC
jgi:hypothetical protein